MRFSVVSLFPELISNFCSAGLVGQAIEKGLVNVDTYHLRDFSNDPHGRVDDKAFGGGDGMVLRYEPLADCVNAIKVKHKNSRVTVLSPQGRIWNQSLAREWASQPELNRVLVCGRYAGIDQRFVEKFADDEISIGDFVLNGGEVAAMAIIESVARLKEGVLGNALSAKKDSFTDGKLECPQFTRPREIQGLSVPSGLLSGNHAEIAKLEWSVSVARTQRLRPDLNVSSQDLRAALKFLDSLPKEDLERFGLGDLDTHSRMENKK